MKIIICDDCENDRAKIHSWFEKYCTETKHKCDISEAESGEQLCMMPDLNDYDVLFMDYYMKGLNGIDTARKVRELGFEGVYIFITSSAEHVFQSFEFDVIDYLLKPITYERFLQAADKLFRAVPDDGSEIILNVDGATRGVAVKKIYCIETDSNHSTLVHMCNSSFHSLSLISDIEKELAPYSNFLRCHRSYIINLDHVSGTEKTTVYLKNGLKAYLPQRDATVLRKRINEYLWKCMMED